MYLAKSSSLIPLSLPETFSTNRTMTSPDLSEVLKSTALVVVVGRCALTHVRSSLSVATDGVFPDRLGALLVLEGKIWKLQAQLSHDQARPCAHYETHRSWRGRCHGGVGLRRSLALDECVGRERRRGPSHRFRCRAHRACGSLSWRKLHQNLGILR